MALLPENGAAFDEIEFVEAMYPTKTYAMDIENGRIAGYTDGQEAMKQAIYKILSTERFTYPVYSDNYGVELTELFGMPVSYVLPELKRYIREALEWDERIESVDSFGFEIAQRGKVHATFTAHTIFGDVEADTYV